MPLLSASIPRLLLLFSLIGTMAAAASTIDPDRRPGSPTAVAVNVGPIASGMDVDLGGDDVEVVASPGEFPNPELMIASDGTVFVANLLSLSPSRIDIYRSLDGGQSFALWSSFTDPAGGYYRGVDAILAEGVEDRIYLAYVHSTGDDKIKIASAGIHAAAPVWTIGTALISPGVQMGVGNEVSLATDAADFSAYYLYLACRGSDGDGGDIWFTRSTDFGTTWETGYRAVSFSAGTGAHYLNPHLSYGGNGYVHLAYNWLDPDSNHTAMHRRIADYADPGSASWSSQTILGTGAGGWDMRVSGALADPSGSHVFIQLIEFTAGSGLHWSTDFGATWPSGSVVQTGLDPFTDGEMDLRPSDGSLRLVGSNNLDGHPDLEIRLQKFDLASPGTPDAPQLISREPWTIYNHYYGLARDPSRGDRYAVVWQTYVDDAYRIFFDAEWLRDEGRPVTDVGFPLDIPGGGGFTPPAIVNVDGDPYGEIVFATLTGQVYVVSHVGTIPGGWPQNLGADVPIDGPVAVGDLNGDDEPEIVVGTTDGRVFAFRRDSSLLSGFPVDLGTDANTYVSIGALGPPYHRGIVATSGDQIHVLKWDGDVIDPWSGFAVEGYNRPAAIGDLDGDGTAEIVVCQSTGVQIRRLDASGVVDARLGFPGTINDMPALGDVDLDGDLEIAIPLSNGMIYLLNDDLTDYPGFPVDVGAGVGVRGMALVNLVGTFDLEVVYARIDGGVGILNNTGAMVPGFPKTTGGTVYQPPTVTQLGGSPDMLVSSGTSVFAWENLSAVPDGWPRNLGSGCEESPAAGDLDLDGSNEIVVLTDDKLWVFDVNTPPDFGAPGANWPMYGFDPQRTGCQSCLENTDTAVAEAGLPTRLSFAPPFPNPASSMATFRFSVPRDADVSLEMFDARGRRVRTVFEGRVPAGEVLQQWDGHSDGGRRVAHGVYQARLTVRSAAGEEKLVRKVIWTK